MSATRAFLILGAVIGLTACGSSNSTQPAEKQQAAAPPAIEAIDEPVPEAAWKTPPAAATGSTTSCIGGDQALDRCTVTPAQGQKLIRAAHAIEPAKGVEPRAIAQLKLTARGANDRARLVAWRSRSGELCTETEIEQGDRGSGGGPNGPCVPARCSKLCLDLMGSGRGETLYLLSGIVDSKADELRITYDDGRVVPYGLTGPLVPGFPGYRIFMLDLGRSLYERLELRVSDKDIAEETLSRAQIQLLRCGDEVPPALPGQEGTSKSSKLHECLQRATPK